jgi:hypothetical protein
LIYGQSTYRFHEVMHLIGLPRLLIYKMQFSRSHFRGKQSLGRIDNSEDEWPVENSILIEALKLPLKGGFFLVFRPAIAQIKHT